MHTKHKKRDNTNHVPPFKVDTHHIRDVARKNSKYMRRGTFRPITLANGIKGCIYKSKPRRPDYNPRISAIFITLEKDNKLYTMTLDVTPTLKPYQLDPMRITPIYTESVQDHYPELIPYTTPSPYPPPQERTHEQRSKSAYKAWETRRQRQKAAS